MSRVLRRQTRVCYHEPEEPSFDDYIFCTSCGDYVYEYCSIHGRFYVVPDDKLYDRERRPSHAVDARAADRSNWMRYVNCSRHWAEQNLLAFQYRGQLYYRTVKTIPRSTELLVFYGSQYALSLGINLRRYHSPVLEVDVQLGEDCAETSGQNRHTDSKCDQNDLTPNPLENENDIPAKYDDFIKLINEIDEIETPTGNEVSSKYVIDSTTSDFDDADIDVIVKKRLDEIIVENFTVDEPKYDQLNSDSAIYSEEEISRAIDSIVRVEDEENNFEKTTNYGFVERIECTNFDKISTINERLDDSGAIEPDSSLRSMNASSNIDSKKALANRYEMGEPGPSGIQMGTIKTPEQHFLGEFLHFDRSDYSVEVLNENDDLISSVQSVQSNSNQVTTKPSTSKQSLEQDNVNNDNKKNKIVKGNKKQNKTKDAQTRNKFKCELCESRFRNKKGLSNHVAAKHGPRVLKCSLCDYTTTRPYKLKMHARQHTGERPFKCHLCNYSCTRKDLLKLHILNHTGEKPYVCEKCDAKFKCLKYLNRHIKDHCPMRIDQSLV